MLLYISFRCS